MNKRQFLQSGLTLGIASVAAATPLRTLYAQSNPGYELIDPPLNPRTSDKVEVIEYFWFGCPHCFRFEPVINAWKAEKPDYIEFVREAPPLNSSWEAHSRAFYAAELMGVTEQFVEPMFQAIHVDKRRLRSPKQIAAFAGELDIDEDLFLKTMDSFATNTRLNQSMQLARSSGLTGVPAIVVHGKYRTSASLAGSNQAVISVINSLAKQEYDAMQG